MCSASTTAAEAALSSAFVNSYYLLSSSATIHQPCAEHCEILIQLQQYEILAELTTENHAFIRIQYVYICFLFSEKKYIYYSYSYYSYIIL